MATSHGVVQGYNANAMVDDKRQIVTHAQIFGSGSDSSNMQPMLDGAKGRLEAIGKKKPLEGKRISADTGYFLRSKCLRNPNTESRQVHVFYGDRPGSITDAMNKKIDTPEGRKQ